MKLKIVNDKTIHIPAKLGIPLYREEELMNFVETIYCKFIADAKELRKDNLPIPLVKYYAELAEYCNNI